MDKLYSQACWHWPARRSTRRRKLEIAENDRRNATDFDGCSVKLVNFLESGVEGSVRSVSRSWHFDIFWRYVARWGFRPFPALRLCFNGILSAFWMHLSFCRVGWWYWCFPLWQVERWITHAYKCDFMCVRWFVHGPHHSMLDDVGCVGESQRGCTNLHRPSHTNTSKYIEYISGHT